MMPTKDTNPKDAIAGGKLPLDLVPSTLEIFAALAFLEGALKYGKFNWRIAGVRSSVYIAALKRHVKKFEDGEWCDRRTGVPHLASVLACTGIILDAFVAGKLTDDRAPSISSSVLIDSFEKHVAHLKEIFKDHSPHQYTIADGVTYDAGRTSEGEGKGGSEAVRSLPTLARAKRHGQAVPRLQRLRRRAPVRHRNKGARRKADQTARDDDSGLALVGL